MEEKELVDIDLELIRRLGVYPYEHMTSFDRFNETEIPPLKFSTVGFLVVNYPMKIMPTLKRFLNILK